MNAKLEHYFYEKYPVLFSEHTGSTRQTCMCWGCSCENGWFFLLDHVCKQITNHVSYQHKMVDTYQNYKKKNKSYEIPEAFKEKIPQVVFTQVKEKFGRLRIYCNNSDPHIESIIQNAEDASYYVCEVCGRNDWTVGHTNAIWIKTICSSCADTYEKNYKESFKWELPEENKVLKTLFKEAVAEDEKNRTKLAFEKIKELEERDKKTD